jgi:aconitate hydratase
VPVAISPVVIRHRDDKAAARRPTAQKGGTGPAAGNWRRRIAGSSREHAVIAPRYLGLRLVIAKSYARIRWQNLANFGVLAADFTDPADYDRIDSGDDLSIDALTDALGPAAELTVRNLSKDADFTVRHRLSPRQVARVMAGGQILLVRNRA